MDYLIGHLVGDYIFQNDWMALNKKDKWFNCIVHCFIYSICVCIFTNWWKYFILIFISHIIFDKNLLIYKWMCFFGNFKKIREENRMEIWLWEYAVIDNT